MDRTEPGEDVQEKLASPWRGYASPEDDVPLAGYAALAGIFATGFAALLAVLDRSRRLPARWSARDLVLTGLATHRLSRIVTRDRVTAPLRAPLTKYEGSAGAGEVHEKLRGHGMRRALGTLLTCPYCAAPWLATGLLGALAARPRVTRFVEAMLTTVTISDFAHQLYAGARRLSA